MGRLRELAVETSTYSTQMGGIYVFNLIVGAGALAMPQAFGLSGYLAGSILLAVLAIFSFITVTFVNEAMALANAYARNAPPERSVQQPETEATRLIGTASLPSSSVSSKSSFDIRSRMEMGAMAEMFFSKFGVQLFYTCIIVYLYGDLCIYAVAVPKSLRRVVCGTGNSTTTGAPDDAICFGDINNKHAYYVFLTLFAVLLGPFCYTNVQKTAYLQVFTTGMRWMTFAMMIIIAIIGIASGAGFDDKDTVPSPSEVPIADVSGLPTLFGVSIYSFMCHHSLPSLVTPIKRKDNLNTMFIVDFLLIAGFYFLLCYTAVFRFDVNTLQDLYTLNFQGYSVKFVSYFLALFPVFTLSANFPIIAITLRNNLMTLLHGPAQRLRPRVAKLLFPTLAIGPPIIVAFFTENVGMLVSITGSYAGVGIQYVIPALLCYCGRKKIASIMGKDFQNKHKSVFGGRTMVWIVLGWSIICVALVTFNHACDASETCKQAVFHHKKQ